jgi:hypothetical protein
MPRERVRTPMEGGTYTWLGRHVRLVGRAHTLGGEGMHTWGGHAYLVGRARMPRGRARLWKGAYTWWEGRVHLVGRARTPGGKGAHTWRGAHTPRRGGTLLEGGARMLREACT